MDFFIFFILKMAEVFFNFIVFLFFFILKFLGKNWKNGLFWKKSFGKQLGRISEIFLGFLLKNDP